jgi:hypothetical protein
LQAQNRAILQSEEWTGHEEALADVYGDELRKVEEALQADDFETAAVRCCME